MCELLCKSVSGAQGKCRPADQAYRRCANIFSVANLLLAKCLERPRTGDETVPISGSGGRTILPHCHERRAPSLGSTGSNLPKGRGRKGPHQVVPRPLSMGLPHVPVRGSKSQRLASALVGPG